MLGFFSFSFKAVVFPELSYMRAAQLFYSAVPWFQSFLHPNFKSQKKYMCYLFFYIYIIVMTQISGRAIVHLVFVFCLLLANQLK